MIKRIATELIIFFVLLCLLGPMMHPDLLSDPVERFEKMGELGNYLHPFIYTAVAAVILFIVRLIVNMTRKLIRRGN